MRTGGDGRDSDPKEGYGYRQQEPCDGTPGWATVNLRGTWRVNRHVTLNLLLANLTDQRYRLHGSGIDAPGVDARVTVQGRF